MTNRTSAAKATHSAAVLAARLKTCPSNLFAMSAAGVYGAFTAPSITEENEMDDNGVALDRDPDYIEYVERCYWRRELAPLCMGFAVFVFLFCAASARAATYYVSSSTGNDSNSGTSSASAWRTIAHVNGLSFLPGDSVLFKRGDVWNESLVPSSSGSSGNPITFDAYGTGAAPNLTGYYAVPATAWVLVTGNAWKAPVPSTYTTINFCLFGSIWGQKVSAASSNLTAQWDFYLANGYVYVYSVGNPATYYNEAIVPMALSNVPVINVNGRSWLTFQHFLVNWFDQYGVYVQGVSDHLVFANMESDSMIPEGTQPLGFYVDESAPGPGDIKIYNDEAHLNYDGFRFDGAAVAITMVNDKGYANRDGALVDNTGAVTYSYCHFYASSLAVAGSTDVEWTSGNGPIEGAGNIAADTPAAVQVYQRYPAEVTLTVDDEGMTPGADTYYAGTVLPIADAAGVPVGAAITVGYPLATTLIPEFQEWINAGRDVSSHSMSHTYYVNTDALDIQYVGSGTAAKLTISNNTLTITVTGASDSVSYNLAQGQLQGTMLALAEALAATGKYTYSFMTPCQGPYGTGCSAYTAEALLSQDLADVSAQDVKTAVYHMQLNVTQLTTDEISLSRQWMTNNLTGLPATPVYVYPGGYETTSMQGIAESVPYTGARGALKEDLGVFDTYADGFNLQNITSFGVNPSWQNLAPSALNQKIQALVWKESVWGVPWGIFWHLNELTSTEITDLIQDFQASGAEIQTNTGLVNWLSGGTQEAGTDGNYYYKRPATSMALDFRPTKNSPVVDAGQNLGTEYELDINGVNQNSYGSGWEIGAHVYEGYSVYGDGTGTGSFTIGLTPTALVTLPQAWVNNNEGNALFNYELSLPGTWITGPAPGCTFHAPYWTGTPTSAGLQLAANDIEACRTATGAGIVLDIPPALYTTSSTGGLVIPQSSNTPATNFLVLRSTEDANLPNGQTVCSHGIQDNLASSTDIGLDNPDCAGDAMYYQLGEGLTQISTTVFSMDDQAPYTVSGSSWNSCILPGCDPGGIGNPTLTQTIGNALPSLDGRSMKIVCSSSTASDCLEFYSAPAQDQDTNFTADFWTYLDGNGGTADAFEFVIFQYFGTTEVHWSYQCDQLTGFWRNGTELPSFAWQATTVPCNLSTLAWHHIVFTSHRIAGDTSCAGGYPVEYYDSITVDGVVNSSLPTGCAGPLPTGWAEATGFNFQQDMGSSATTLTQYVDEAKLSASPGAFTLANGTATNTSNYDDVQYMWTAECSGTNCAALQTCSPLGASSTSIPPKCTSTTLAPDHWLIEDMEARMSAGNTGNQNIVSFQVNGNETSASQMCNHIHLRKDWVHGDWTTLGAGANSISAAIMMGCNNSSIVDSQTSQNLRPGSEGHSIGLNWATTHKIDHNWIEGQSSGLFIGGFTSPPTISGLVPGQDEEWRRNRFTFPYSWLGQNDTTCSTHGVGTVPHTNLYWGCTSSLGYNLVRKNAQEFKEGQRILANGNIYENVDDSGGQGGPLHLETIRNSSGTTYAGSNNYQSVISDVTDTNNIYRNGCEGLQFDSSNSALGDGGGVSLLEARISLTNDLLYGITNTNPGCTGVNSVGIYMDSGLQSWKGTLSENSANNAATFIATCSVDGGDCPAGPPSIGFQQFDLEPGDPVSISGCTAVTAFNAATHSVGGYPVPVSAGPGAAAGTTAGALTVTYTWTATGNASDTSGNCVMTKGQGGPRNFTMQHVTFVTDATHALTSSNAPSTGPNLAVDSILQNNIILGGGDFNNPVGEGTATEGFDNDYLSMTFDHEVWPTRTASNYTSYGNNPNDPVGSPVLYFPATPYCSGSASTSSCVGFTGAMSASSMPLALSDYHQYGLRSDSSFYSGNADQASDGTSMGVSTLAIDAAETENLYVCATACGAGPFPDSAIPASPMLFGFTENTTTASNFPTVNYKMQRFWDSPPLQWPSINTAAGVFNFSNLDGNLAQAYANGVTESLYTLARTPPWISSNLPSTSCNYNTGVSGSGPGECDAPSDLNSDGSGTNATWKAWITAIATHVDNPTYLQTHSHIAYWEIWNEPDTEAFWAGSIAQLARLTEDANCIITGRGVIHENGNGSAATCTATAIDPTAKIVMSSAHAVAPALTYGQNELYCNASPTGYQLPCPNPPNAIAAAVDIINFHMKPGNETGNTCPAPTPCTAESAMQMYVSNIQSILQPAELAKPLWDGEAAYSTAGFTSPYTDPDMAASFIARFYLVDWSLGISGIAWYTWDELEVEPAEVQTAYQQVYNWLSNASLYSPCAATGTVWSCGIMQSGKQYWVMWDTSQSCSSGSCSTANQTVGSQWTQYQDMTSASTPSAIVGHSVAVGIKPVVLH